MSPELLGEWMMGQRWYANKGSLPVLEEIGSWSLDSAEPGVEIVTHLLIDHTVGKPALYQVPLVYRASPLSGVPEVGRSGATTVYDGPHDPAYTAALLTLITSELEVSGERTWVLGQMVDRELLSPGRLTSRVLTGEQSNTSIIFEADGTHGTPIICKLFRTLHDGDNPDVELQTALAIAGSGHVPRPLGQVIADWSDKGTPSGRARGHLAFAQEFLPGAEDAWPLALSAARRGIDFAEDARALGIATAAVHATLAATMPTAVMTQEEIGGTVRQMHRRLAAAIVEVPAIADHATALEEVISAAATVEWPAQQRIHGDLHLGQVLSVPGRGWVLVDFEGEPLRPMRERSSLDSPMRDIAGMLRSFDYVAGSLGLPGAHHPEATRLAAAQQWATRARDAFEEGYSQASGCDFTQNRALVDAFEIDKALYEIVYEARNRPDWLGIPVAAIERLSARTSA